MKMNPYLKRRIIDLITRKKTLKSILFLCVSFFLSQIAAIGKGPAIIEYCKEIQSHYQSGVPYHTSRIVEIYYSDWNLQSLIFSAILILLFIYVIYYRGSSYDDLEIFDSIDEARESLGPNREFRLSEVNKEFISSPNSTYVMRT